LLLHAAIIITVLLLTACARPEDRAWQQVQQTGVLRVGLDASYPPFETLEETGQIVGFDADLAAEIGRRLGVQVELVNIAYDGLYDSLVTRRVDLLASALVPLPEAEESVSFSVPYFNAGEHLVVPAGSPVQSMDDLDGRVVAVETGSGGDVEARRWQRRLADLTVERYVDPAAALQAVLDGTADAALVDGIAARLAVGAHPELALAGSVNDLLFTLVTAEESPILLEETNQALEDMLRDGTIERLIEKWFGPQR
jgi:polar amino acid transport system substrate-binding protein